MAAILKLRRGSTAPTSLEQSELFYNSTLGTIQVGKSSASNDNITLVKLTEPNSGNLQIVGTISGSAVTLSGDITASNLTLSGNATIAGNITFGGELITLGDANTDNIVISGELSSSLIPNNDNAFDLGSTDKKYRNVYAYNLNGSVTDINLLNFTASQEAKDSTLSTYTASLETKNATLATYTGSATASIIELFGTASNHSNKFTTLGTYTGSIDDKFTTLASVTGSTTASIIELFGTSSNHESRIVYLSSSFSQSVDDRLDQLEVNSGSVNNSISLLNTFSSSQETKDSTLATYTGSVNNQLTELFSTASDHEIRVDGIQDYTASLRTAIGVDGTNVTINGDLVVQGTTTQINSTQVNIGENILELNYGGSATTAGIITKDATGGSTISGSLLWDSTNDFWKGGKLGNESKLLLAGGDGIVSGSAQVVDALKFTFLEINGDDVVSGSSQINLTQTTNYISGIKSRLDAEGVFSGSTQVNADSITNFDSNVKDKLDIEGVFSGSTQVNADSITNFDSNVKDKLNIDNVISGSSQVTESLDLRYLEINGDSVVSGSSQLTASYDLIYANSQSFHNLVGEWNFGTQGSIRDAAFYSVTSSADIALVSGSINYTNNHLLTAGATKKYIDWRTDEILTAIAVADITAVNAGNGLTGGGTQGDVTLTLDTGSSHFNGGIKTKLNSDSVVSGSSQITIGDVTGFNVFSASVDYRLDALETDTGSQDVRLDALEAFTSSQETKNTTLGTYTGSVDSTISSLNSFSSSINTTIKTKLNTEGVLSGSLQIVNILGPLNTFSASQESKDSTLATYTGSVNSSLSQLNAVSHSHSNKDDLDTIDQNLATTSDVTFGSFHTTGTGSIGTNLTIYGNLSVFGTQSIINSENLQINDNLIYLAPTASGDLDLGIIGHYNDGTYRHGGIFRDASDSGTWKVFKGLTEEVSGSVDTSHASFALADFKAANITATSFNGTINSTNGVISGSSQISGTGITNNTITIAGTSTALGGSISLATITNGSGIVSGSSQITLSSTTGFANYLNQAVKTDSNPKFNSLGVGMDASATAGRIDATNDIVAYSSSDRRFKENITPIENALDKINQIGGYEFDWKEENKIEHGYEGHDLGVIAQEIEAIAPELVQTRENGYKAVKYDKLVSVLIQAVKELSAKVSELENK